MQVFDHFDDNTAPKIVVLGTGGTIAGLATASGDNLDYQAAQLGVAQLMDGLPRTEGLVVVTEQVAQIDSKDMDVVIWHDLALRCAHWLADESVQGIVVTHGTDTLEETAYFLQAALAPAKPVVMACAMRPANALMPDGPQNLRDAVTVAATTDARGVLAVCAGVVHGALDVRKLHAYRLDAFGSGDAGPVGYVEEGVLRRVRAWPATPDRYAPPAQWPAEADDWPRVEIVTSHAGAGGAMVESLVRDGVQGLVVAGTGNGSLHGTLEAALLRAQAAGVRVLRSSRCDQGQVMGKPGDSLPHAGALSPVKARIRLMLELLG